MPSFRPELAVYVTWHPDFENGQAFAEFLYSELTREKAEPLSRGLGIPVYLSTAPDSDSLPTDVDFERAKRTVVVLLVDDAMVMARDQGDPGKRWEDYVQRLLDGAKSESHRIIPVNLSRAAFSLHAGLARRNFLPIDRSMPLPQQKQRLLIGVVHDLCRLLSGSEAVNYEAEDSVTNPVRVFLSHAKKDGEGLTQQFKEFLQNELQLDTFFDRNGIFYADDFGQDIEKRARESALLILQTDAYSTREWCQKEVLFAKQYQRPVLVLQKIEVGETRSFPYIGNVPTMRYTDSTPIELIIGKLLVEVLRFLYFPLQARGMAELFGIDLSKAMLLAHSPELINLIPRADSTRTIVYPDPPVGRHEVELLQRCDANSQLSTPMFLVAGKPFSPVPLIGLSLSETATDPELFAAQLKQLGYLKHHFDDVFYEMARYLLASGANLAYGGDLRKGGFTECLHGLARQYSEQTQDPSLRVETFLAWVAHINVPMDRLLEMQAKARQWRLPPSPDVIAELKLDPKKPPTGLNRSDTDYLLARCFTAMRETMQGQRSFQNAAPIRARVLLGGPLAGYAGRYPGLVEEAYFAVKANSPVYLIGAFGGCTQAIIDAIESRNPKSLTMAGQVELDEQIPRPDPDKAKTLYAQRAEDFNRRAAKYQVEPINYDAVLAEFQKVGANNLEGLNKANGLTPEENRRLFSTTHVSEMIYLIFKGLRSILT